MSELLQGPPIMSVTEFRKLTGSDTAHFSDDEIKKYIAQLDNIAQLFVSSKKQEVMPMKQNS